MHKHLLDPKFRDEVLIAGSESTLPVNLNDKWLNLLTSQGDDYRDLKDTPEDIRITELVAAVFHIIAAKKTEQQIKLDDDDLDTYICIYHMELIIEQSRRFQGTQHEPATMQTVLLGRDLGITYF